MGSRQQQRENVSGGQQNSGGEHRRPVGGQHSGSSSQPTHNDYGEYVGGGVEPRKKWDAGELQQKGWRIMPHTCRKCKVSLFNQGLVFNHPAVCVR